MSVGDAELRDALLGTPSGLRRRYRVQQAGVVATGLCVLLAALFLAALLVNVFRTGWSAVDWHFVTSELSSRPAQAGIFPVIVGSLYLMALTLVFAVPTGVAAAVYLHEFAEDTRLTRFLRRIIENLAGVPSIVFGLLGLALFVRLFGFGTSLLAGGLTLGLLILPIIVVASEEALASVPQEFRDAALGLGATRWQAVRSHVLPNALPGILTGTILALSRAIGETAPILFMASVFARSAPTGLLDGFLALPLTIFFWTRHPKAEFHELAAATIIVLLALLLAMNAVAVAIRQWSLSRRSW